jgi:copper(I)-binding protein
LGSIEIREPWARAASARSRQGAGFVTLTNKGSEPDRLVGARSPAVERIEIHAIKVVGPNMQMRPRAEGLVLPAGVTLTLKPRGYHLLLIGLAAPLAPGALLPVTLVFEKAGTIDIELAAGEPGPVGGAALHA